MGELGNQIPLCRAVGSGLQKYVDDMLFCRRNRRLVGSNNLDPFRVDLILVLHVKCRFPQHPRGQQIGRRAVFALFQLGLKQLEPRNLTPPGQVRHQPVEIALCGHRR